MSDPKPAATHARAWGLPNVVSYFDRHRDRTDEVYESEWVFLKGRLAENSAVLDVGCAQGGFAAVLGEHLKNFSYTGIDINADMIARARARFPGHSFHHVTDCPWPALANQRFDLVLVLGILHLHETWRDTIAAAWAHTEGALILDLRETWQTGIEDTARSSFAMDFNGGDGEHRTLKLPYNVINSADALAEVLKLCPGARRVSQHGYSQAPSGAAETPFETVIAKAYCIER